LARLREGVDAVTVTSPSTLQNFLALLGDEGRHLLADAIVATIGPVTTEAARAAGVRVDVQPEEYTVGAMVEALERYAG
jgi:uroporphyrinogen III methyltransferase/synthase